MSTIYEILAVIEGKAGNYREWTVGTTTEPQDCKVGHGSPNEWYCWDAGSPDICHVIEDHLVARGMRNHSSRTRAANFLYVFRSDATSSNTGASA